MINDTAFFLRDIWYYALPGGRLKRGAMVAKTILGEPVLFGRAADGRPFALRNICPHRGIPLTDGRFDGSEIECCYHGWRFDTQGQCKAIPSLVAGQDVEPSRIKVRRYPCRELQGNVWIFMAEPKPGAAAEEHEDGRTLPEVPLLPGLPPDARYGIAETLRFPCSADQAVIGLIDPAHGPFVHRSWWWRSRRPMKEKTKSFAPSPFGFTMDRHAPPANYKAYAMLGGAPQTEIIFRLPGLRIDHTETGRHTVVNMTVVTPVTAEESEVNHVVYWTIPWLTLLKPVLGPYVRAFLRQDREVFAKLQAGLRHAPPQMMIRDADTQVRWYYQLKKEFLRAGAEGREFVNPIKERVLRWRS